MKAYVDHGRCRGYGICTELAATVFSFGENGQAVAEERPLTAGEIDQVRQAARMCPERAITSED